MEETKSGSVSASASYPRIIGVTGGPRLYQSRPPGGTHSDCLELEMQFSAHPRFGPALQSTVTIFLCTPAIIRQSVLCISQLILDHCSVSCLIVQSDFLSSGEQQQLSCHCRLPLSHDPRRAFTSNRPLHPSSPILPGPLVEVSILWRRWPPGM